MADSVGPQITGSGKRNAFPLYAPRFWHGMRMRPWLRLLIRNRFRVHPFRMPMVVMVTGCALFNSAAARIQNWRYGRRIAQTRIELPPLFVIGHWRSGTTFLHELLTLDERFTSPTTFECFAPEHFLVTKGFMPKLIQYLIPAKRPMDDVEMGLDRPQEDEIALCAMGAPTPMARLAFPNHEPPYPGSLNLDEAAPGELAAWRSALQQFVRSVSMSRPTKRLVLKSPPHTGRIAYLAEMFPGAQFVHIARDPRAIFGSTVRLWKTLDYDQGFQIPRHEHLVEYVFQACETMYRGYENQRKHIAPENLHELRYEDLVQDPSSELSKIYDKLNFGQFEDVRPAIEAFMHGRRQYRAACYNLPADLEAEIRRRWAFYFERYGYDVDRVRVNES